MPDNTFPRAPAALRDFLRATAANDVDAMFVPLADNAELVSPLFARATVRRRGDLGVLLAAVYGSLTDLRWTQVVATVTPGWRSRKGASAGSASAMP